jgi:cell division protein FtsW
MVRMRSSIRRLALRQNPIGRGIVLTTLSLLAMGVVMVHSAKVSLVASKAWYAREELRHTIYAALAAGVLLLAWRIDYHRLGRGGRLPVVPALGLVFALLAGFLVFVPGIGKEVGGDARWIRIGPPGHAVTFQPSELIKLGLIVFLASWLARTERVGSFLRTFVPAAALIGLSVMVVVTQDFGAAVVIGVAACVTLLLAGVPWYHLATLLPPAAAGFYFFVMKAPHRWARIEAMLNPWTPGASTYQPQQSMLAVLTGGWLGKGPGAGIQKMGFLPEDHTDFIFSAFCEEWGFVGAVLLLGLVVMWTAQAYRAAASAGDRFGRLLVGALGFLISVQAVLHVAVNIGAAPPMGVSLPFVSYGGTALLLAAAATAMIVSVTAHRRPELADL